VELPPGRIVDRLRAQQDSHFNQPTSSRP
jgi:hypothetical protein